jgi:nucleotide-binding universal stress UspA family protein
LFRFGSAITAGESPFAGVPMFETVLFPIHQSHQAMETASQLLELVHRHNSRLVLLSVLEQDHSGTQDLEAVAQLLQRTQDQMNRAGVPCEVLEREGRPACVIGNVAAELNVDVIVMGTRGVNLNSDSESTAARVIQLAPCPVLVVP